MDIFTLKELILTRRVKLIFKLKLVNIINDKELKLNIENIKIPELTQKFGSEMRIYKYKKSLR